LEICAILKKIRMEIKQIQIISTQEVLQELIDNSVRISFEKLKITSTISKSNNEELVTTKQLCEYLGLTEPTIIRWRLKGKIPFFKIGTSIRFSLSNVKAAIEVTQRKGVNAI